MLEDSLARSLGPEAMQGVIGGVPPLCRYGCEWAPWNGKGILGPQPAPPPLIKTPRIWEVRVRSFGGCPCWELPACGVLFLVFFFAELGFKNRHFWGATKLFLQFSQYVYVNCWKKISPMCFFCVSKMSK